MMPRRSHSGSGSAPLRRRRTRSGGTSRAPRCRRASRPRRSRDPDSRCISRGAPPRGTASSSRGPRTPSARTSRPRGGGPRGAGTRCARAAAPSTGDQALRADREVVEEPREPADHRREVAVLVRRIGGVLRVGERRVGQELRHRRADHVRRDHAVLVELDDDLADAHVAATAPSAYARSGRPSRKRACASESGAPGSRRSASRSE